MSPNSRPISQIVVDASIAGAASSIERMGTSGPGILCRNFLQEFEACGHVAVFGPKLREEWMSSIRSKFASEWRNRMISQGKTVFLDDAIDNVAQLIRENTDVADTIPLMLKDAHLLVLALKTELKVASKEKQSRRHYSLTLQNNPEIKSIVWVNPTIDSESAIDWLQSGALIEDHRRLGNSKSPAS